MNHRRDFLNAIGMMGTASLCKVTQALDKGRRIRAGQIGTKHAHASGKIGTLRKYPQQYDLVGVVEPDNARWEAVKNSAPYKDVPDSRSNNCWILRIWNSSVWRQK